MTEDKKIWEWCVCICLLLLLVGRLFLNDEWIEWIQFIGLAGVIIALVDLYRALYRNNYKKDKFKIIRGMAIVIGTILVIGIVVIALGHILLGSKGNDILTILALLISLPNELYCSWINSYLNR